MRVRDPKGSESYAGSLLIAHPALKDPNFRKTIILMTSHSPDGAMGMVLNRPLDRNLGQLGTDFALGPLAAVPLFSGGPVQTEQLIIATWQNHPSGFQFHLGIEPDTAAQMVGEAGTQVRAFFGYSGWGAGQLETELKGNTWIVTAPPADLLSQPPGTALWRKILIREGPEWRLLANEPDEPGEN